MKDKEIRIMQHLRRNARESLTKMSRKTGIPVSTIYERLKKFEGNEIMKHTCLIDFRVLGYDLRVTMLVKCAPQQKEPVATFLTTHHQVNTVARINNGYDFMAEVVFRNMNEVQGFMDSLERKGVTSINEYYVLEELQREAFLSSDAHRKLLAPTLVQG